MLGHPEAAIADPAGNLFLADSYNCRVRKVTPAGTITTIAGHGAFGYSGDGGPAIDASFGVLQGLAMDGAGDLFITDTYSGRIRKMSADGMVTTVAGGGERQRFSGRIPATDAFLLGPSGISVDPSGNLFIADTGDNRILKVDTNGMMSTVAGGGCGGIGPSGSPCFLQLLQPSAVAVDPDDNLFIADTSNFLVRRVSAHGVVTTVAGNGTFGFSGDGGPAIDAQLRHVYGLSLDHACGLLIADTENNRIRRVDGMFGLAANPAAVYLDSTAQPAVPVSLTAMSSGCTWSSAAGAPWIGIASGASGSGNGTVMLSVPANTTAAARSATLTIGGLGIPVTQRAMATVFSDVTPPDSYFDYAGLLYQGKITAGCSTSPLKYCPNSLATRGEMALILVTAVTGGKSFAYNSTPYFTDVPPSHPFFKFIQKLRDLGITSGCSATQFCPDDSVTRGQMAVFIIRARYETTPYTYPATPYFTDVPASYPFFPFIQKMAQTGITAGCAPNLYCPDATLTRGQMAVFIVTGLLNQLLPAGTAYIASVAPDSAAPTQAVTVTLTGVNTHFVQGVTQVTAAPGITASGITVTSATTLTVQLAIGASVTPNPASIVVTTGSEEAVLPNGFIVTAAQ